MTDLGRSFRDAGAFFYKIPDMPHLPGAARFDTEKPFDAFAVYAHRRFAIEAKALDGYQAFGLRHLRHCQEVGLNDFDRSGGESWVFVLVELPSEQRLIMLPWHTVRDRAHSLKKVQMEAKPYLKRAKGRYEVGEWLKS